MSTVRPYPRAHVIRAMRVSEVDPRMYIRYRGHIVERNSPEHWSLRIQVSRDYQTLSEAVTNAVNEGSMPALVRANLLHLFEVLVKKGSKIHQFSYLKDTYKKKLEWLTEKVTINPTNTATYNMKFLMDTYKEFPNWLKRLVPVEGRNFLGFY